MSITDELRRYINGPARIGITLVCGKAITDIADRIDAEYQKAIRKLNDLVDASVPLPADADGEIIHVGDMMERGKARGHVIALMLSNYPKEWGGELHWGVQLEGEQAPTALDVFLRHHHEPTVEDVLRDFAYCCEEGATEQSIDEIIAEYAAKLRLAGDAE